MSVCFSLNWSHRRKPSMRAVFFVSCTYEQLGFSSERLGRCLTATPYHYSLTTTALPLHLTLAACCMWWRLWVVEVVGGGGCGWWRCGQYRHSQNPAGKWGYINKTALGCLVLLPCIYRYVHHSYDYCDITCVCTL